MNAALVVHELRHLGLLDRCEGTIAVSLAKHVRVVERFVLHLGLISPSLANQFLQSSGHVGLVGHLFRLLLLHHAFLLRGAIDTRFRPASLTCLPLLL